MIRSLRLRLALISTLVSGAVITGLGLFSWRLMLGAVQESTDTRLEGIAGRILPDVNPWSTEESLDSLFESRHGDDLASGFLALSARELTGDEFRNLGGAGWTETIENSLPPGFPKPDPDPVRRPRPRPGGPGEGPGRPPREVFGGPGEFERPPPPRPDAGPRLLESTEVTVGGERWRVLAAQERGFAVLVGINFTRANPGLVQLRRGLLFGVPLALFFVGLGGWLVAERALRPLRRITATARRISVGALHERMPGDPHSDPEIARLTAVLNAMMDRLEAAFAHANRFSADVSHELRTPIAVMQGEIENALRECGEGSREESTLVGLRGELDRLKSIIASLLVLARADVGNLLDRRAPLDLSAELGAVAEDAAILCEAAGLRFEAEIEEGLAATGDALLLRQALLNLVKNAVKFNLDGGFVRLAASRGRDGVVVAVENSGPGIAEEDRDRIFDRFYRADRSRSRKVDGFGLGLSLARVIAEGHGGSLDLEDGSPGRTRFALRLPLQQD